MGALSIRQRHIQRLVWTCALSAVLSAHVFAQEKYRATWREKPKTAVADLRYGTSLYRYYLDDYMGAISELLVAEQRGGIKGHGDSPEIMEGGLALGYSMERYATEIFERLLKNNRPVEIRDAAWYYLAKLRYQRQEWRRCDEALKKISAKPPKNLRYKINELRLNVYLKQGKPDVAAKFLKRLDVSADGLPYFYFNIGSAYAREQNYKKAVAYFNRLARKQYRGEEHRTLYDKAMTAAGYAYLFQKEYAHAKNLFSRVRLSSSMSNRALLGYGWACSSLGEYKEALKSWLYLAESDLIDENNQEALIAVPYAYEKLGSEALALTYYKQAETRIEDEILNIDLILASVANETLLQALEIQADTKLDWLSFSKDNQLSPRLAYLVRLFAQDSFQGSVQELQDLLALKKMLNDWREKIAFYADMVETREKNRAQRSQFFRVSELEKRLQAMKRRRTEVQKTIESISAEKDVFALSDGDEKALVKRIRRSEANLRVLKNDPFIDEYEESVRRYKGLLVWQASDAFSDRLWSNIKRVNQLDDALVSISNTYNRVTELTNTAPDLAPYKSRLAQASDTINGILAEIEATIIRNEGNLKKQLTAVLRDQRRRLGNYLGQSRLSVARMYDKARVHVDEKRKAEIKAREEKEKAAKEVKGRGGR